MNTLGSNMDKVLEKKRGLRTKHIPYLAGGAAVVLAVGWLVFGNHASKMRVDGERVTVSNVTRGEFNDYVRINAQVLPINTVQLSALEGGMVAERLVEEGSMVRAGEVVIRLTNPALNLQILESETRLAEQENYLRNTQVTMQQEKLILQQNRLSLDLDVERKRRKFEQYENLYNDKLTSREEYLQAREDYNFAVSGRDLVLQRQQQDSLFRTVQTKQMEDDLMNIRRNVSFVRQRVEELNVKAPVDGQLGQLDVEIGQYVGSGGRLGQISVLTDYKVEALIDEHYIDRVRQGLDATFERQDRNFALQARRVYPEVRNGQFKTDFTFVGERPDNIRAGQTYYVNLQLGQPTESVLIPRGTFYQTTGGKWIFVVTPDGSRAVRRPITIGRQNTQFYEVTSGLEPGERVVTSSYDTYGDVQELVLQ
jgi:HlyD family secretion protein